MNYRGKGSWTLQSLLPEMGWGQSKGARSIMAPKHIFQCDLFSQAFDRIISPCLLFFPNLGFLSGPICLVTPIPAGHAVRLQDGTASPSSNNVDFQCWLLTHPEYGFSNQIVSGSHPQSRLCGCAHVWCKAVTPSGEYKVGRVSGVGYSYEGCY